MNGQYQYIYFDHKGCVSSRKVFVELSENVFPHLPFYPLFFVDFHTYNLLTRVSVELISDIFVDTYPTRRRPSMTTGRAHRSDWKQVLME